MTPVRAVAHVHSDWSYDGRWSLEELAQAFGRRGCDVVLMSEHDRGFDEARWQAYREACARASTPSTLLVPGIEYADPTDTVHVLVWGELPFLGEGQETVELLRRAREHDAVSVLAHAGRRDAWQRFDSEWASLLTGIEIWNRKYDGVAPGRAALALRARAPHLRPFVGLDFHTRRQFFPLRLRLPSAESAAAASARDVLGEKGWSPFLGSTPVGLYVTPPLRSTLDVLERGRKAAAKQVRRRARAKP